MAVTVSTSPFGRLPDGTAVELYTLRCTNGFEVTVSTYGGILTSVRTPDRDGAMGEVTLARNTLEEFVGKSPYYGAFIGRVCNRISRGGFELDGKFYSLASNSGDLHLHGGNLGFDKRVYDAETESDAHSATVYLTRTSPDGEEGYPGALKVKHGITVHDDMRITFTFEAETDAPTIVNLTNHTYWNLSGEEKILNHEVRLPGKAYAATREKIPTGDLVPVSGTPYDFTAWKRIGKEIAALDGTDMGGYDHSWVVDGWKEDRQELRMAAELRAPDTGRVMEVRTTYPAVHFYSGNNLPGQIGRDGSTLTGREALCFECQFFPDTPHRPEFPPIILRPGERFHHLTEHRFFTY